MNFSFTDMVLSMFLFFYYYEGNIGLVEYIMKSGFHSYLPGRGRQVQSYLAEDEVILVHESPVKVN